MGAIISALNVPNVAQDLQQTNYLLLHPQTQANIVQIKDPNTQNAIETLRIAQLQTNQAIWNLTQGEHPFVSKEVEKGPNAPKFSRMA